MFNPPRQNAVFCLSTTSFISPWTNRNSFTTWLDTTELGAWLTETTRELKRACSQVYWSTGSTTHAFRSSRSPSGIPLFLSNWSQKPCLTSKHLKKRFILLFHLEKRKLIIFSPANKQCNDLKWSSMLLDFLKKNYKILFMIKVQACDPAFSC